MCSCGGEGLGLARSNSTCNPWNPPQRRNVFDMLTDPCAKTSWHCCKAQIYGDSSCGSRSCSSCTQSPPCSKFPPRRCPPPPPPAPGRQCTRHRSNPVRACGFIVKPCNHDSSCRPPECCPPAEGNFPGYFSLDPGVPCDGTPVKDPSCLRNSCSRPAGSGCPDPCFTCAGRQLCCRPHWKIGPLRGRPYCATPPPLPPRSLRYKCWLSAFRGKVDTNICASRYSGRVDRSGKIMVIVEPPACGEQDPCPCHPCA